MLPSSRETGLNSFPSHATEQREDSKKCVRHLQLQVILARAISTNTLVSRILSLVCASVLSSFRAIVNIFHFSSFIAFDINAANSNHCFPDEGSIARTADLGYCDTLMRHQKRIADSKLKWHGIYSPKALLWEILARVFFFLNLNYLTSLLLPVIW